MMKRTRDAGVTLIEIIIASIIMAILFGIVFLILMSSSKHVENQNASLALENEAREILEQITLDLRQTRMVMLKDGSTGVAIAPNDSTVEVKSGYTLTYPYTDFQFKTPASAFDLAKYKANSDAAYTREVRYRFRPEVGEVMDGADNNRNGVKDDGYIEKTETYYTYDLVTKSFIPDTTKKTAVTRIGHDVQANGLQFWVPATTQGRVQVTLTLERTDTKDFKKTFTKTVQTMVDLRN